MKKKDISASDRPLSSLGALPDLQGAVALFSLLEREEKKQKNKNR